MITNLFKKIADNVSDLLKNPAVREERDFANSTRLTGEEVLKFLRDKTLVKQYTAGLQIGHNGKFDFLSGAIYHDYFKSLPTNGQSMERKDPLSSWRYVVERACSDLAYLAQHFNVDETANGKALRLSMIVVDGYITMAGEFFQWIFYQLATAVNYRPDFIKTEVPRLDGYSPPGAPYMAKKAASMTQDAISFARSILVRHNRDSFPDLIKQMKETGRDVLLETAGHTFDNYADEKNYKKDELNYAEFGFRNPISAFNTRSLIKAKEIYDRNKATRDWLAACVARSNLNAHQAAEGSPEQKKYQALTQSYLDLVSEYDKKLAQLSLHS